MAQGLNALKSALVMSSASTMLHFEIMTDHHQMSAISEKLNELKRKRSNFTYKLRPVEYPNRSTAPTWRKLFKECASQRLFLPDILRDVDSVLYIDTDVLFVSPVESVWGHFSRMNGSQIAGMSYESEDFSTSWYYRFAKHPYYGYYGLNSGVMLMNLTRMRAFRWVDRLEPVLRQYRSQIVWGDQDIINVIFHEHPAMLYLFGCNWNYRPDHCVYASVCKAAAVEDKAGKGNAEGIRLVHGNRGVFLHDDKQPEFRALYLAFSRLPILEDVHRTRSHLAESIRTALAELPNPSRCAKVSHLFWRQIAQTIPSGGSTQSEEKRG